jgi:hypothetical protein
MPGNRGQYTQTPNLFLRVLRASAVNLRFLRASDKYPSRLPVNDILPL